MSDTSSRRVHLRNGWGTMAKPGLIHDCPNCPAESQGFDLIASYDHPAPGLSDSLRDGRREFLIFQCNRCHYPVVVEIYRRVAEHASAQPLELTADYRNQFYVVLSVRPSRERVGSAPEHTPKNIAIFFEQACRALARGDADVAGMGFGKALDVATRQLIRTLQPPDLEAKLRLNLKRRIDWLHEQGKLTDDLRAWAHLMRDERNDAAHEEEPYTDEEANDLRDLTEVFLMYVYMIPGKIAQRHPDIVQDASK